MKDNARDLIYLDTKRYISISKIKTFYWVTLIIQIFMVIVGIASIKTNGVNLKSLFPLICSAVWSLLYWIFVLMIQSKRTRKTFELRFMVNGICGLLTSLLFLCIYITICLVADSPAFDPGFTVWILLTYLLISLLYIGLIVIGVHKGVFKKIRKKSNVPIVLAVDAFLAAILPLAGLFGIFTSGYLRAHASAGAQDIAAAVCFVLLIFIPALAHINFVQYYYCKKYGIISDENGDTTSPMLERGYKEKNTRRKSYI